MPSRDVIQNALSTAIDLACLNDRLLFDEGVRSERAIVFRVGQYLDRIVDAWDGNWVVDAEYGRWYPGDDSVEQKMLSGRPATPDLVVHKRGTKQNLLVVEAKIHPVNDEKRWRDYAKLNGFLTDVRFRYKHAVFLEFRSGGPQRWLWVERTRRLGTDLHLNFDLPLEDVPNAIMGSPT